MKKIITLLFSFFISIFLLGCTSKIMYDNKNMTDEDLLNYTKADFDKEKMMLKEITIGRHNGLPVKASFPCGDICPEYTLKIVSYDIEISQCENMGGVVKSTFIPKGVASMPEKFCFPEIIIDNNIYNFIDMDKITNGDTSSITKDKYTYCEKVKYEKDKILEFPDFSLKYTEQNTVFIPSENSPHQDSITYDNFEIFKGSEKITVSYAIDKMIDNSFKFNNKEYVLKIFGENELVISTKEEYEKCKEKIYNFQL